MTEAGIQNTSQPFSKIKELVQEEVKQKIEGFLKTKPYNSNEAPKWTHSLSEEIVILLQSKDREFKYAATCIIINKSDNGFHMSSSCFWNSESDGNLVLKIETETLYCIVNIFGFSLN